MKDQIRVVIDTNIWISYLLGHKLSNLTEHIVNKNVKILFCDEQFTELLEVLNRQKFKKHIKTEHIQELISLIDTISEFVQITQHVKLCRDPKDNFLLDLCLVGNADYLVTGDMDLLALNPFQHTEIIDYRTFENFI
ncbi:putative toxin-antitoxin system toxin component, PIN family [candidate division KSB1 bacterium]|nr:putative toxin-antitoxin system toxin component, PIN family [candidate division KSB1 bacterium]